jgi:hypothetical protein
MNKTLHKLTDELEYYLPNSTEAELQIIYSELTEGSGFRQLYNKALSRAKKRIEYKNNQRTKSE